MTLAERFGANLRKARVAAGLSQEEAARRAQVHRTQWSLWERGHRVPRVIFLVRLAGACDVTPSDLLAGIEWSPPPGINFGGLIVREDT